MGIVRRKPDCCCSRGAARQSSFSLSLVVNGMWAPDVECSQVEEAGAISWIAPEVLDSESGGVRRAREQVLCVMIGGAAVWTLRRR